MDRTPLYICLAMIVGIMRMPLDIYDVHAWNLGHREGRTVEDEGVDRRASRRRCPP